MPDKFEDLTTYLAILDTGGVNAAAAELGIAKSAVSRRLSDLERRLGATLIDRASRRFEPTAVGIEYARRARGLLKSLEELDASVAPSESAGSVTIRASREIITHRLVPALAGLGDATRSFAVRFVDEAATPKESGCHIIVEAGSASGGVRALFKTTSVLCAAPGYLSEHGTPEGPRRLDGHRTIRIAGADPSAADVVVPDTDSALAAAIAGLGIARLPDFVVASVLADGALVRVAEARDAEPVTVVARLGDDAGPLARRLVDALATAFC